MDKDIIEITKEIIQQNTVTGTTNTSEPYCVLSLIDDKGFPTTSVITASKADGMQWVTFCTGLESNKAKRIENCNRASVCFASETHNITLVGSIEIVTDASIKKEMWYDGMGNHFSGADDPAYCVLRFRTERYKLLVNWQEAEGILQ